MTFLLLVLLVAAALYTTTAFAPRPQYSVGGLETSRSSPLFGLEEELEGEPDEGGEALAAEFADLERGKKLTPKDIADLENDDLDPDNLVVRGEILEDGTKIVDYKFSEDEDYRPTPFTKKKV